MLEQRGRYWNNPRDIVASSAGTRPDICQVRSPPGLGAVAQEADVDFPRGLELLDITPQLSLQIRRVRAHRSETLGEPEEVPSKQSFEVPNKAEAVIHPHRSQCVLSEQAQPGD